MQISRIHMEIRCRASFEVEKFLKCKELITCTKKSRILFHIILIFD